MKIGNGPAAVILVLVINGKLSGLYAPLVEQTGKAALREGESEDLPEPMETNCVSRTGTGFPIKIS